MKRSLVAIALFLSGFAFAKTVPVTRGMKLCGKEGTVEIWSDRCIGSRDGRVHVSEGAMVVMVVRD